MFGRRRILIVDGGAVATEDYPSWLMGAHHDTSIASDTARAFILAPLLRPQVVLVDLEHVLVTSDWLRLLRAAPELCVTRFIALGPSEAPKWKVVHQASDFDLFLARPLERATLLNAVRTLRPNRVST